MASAKKQIKEENNGNIINLSPKLDTILAIAKHRDKLDDLSFSTKQLQSIHRIIQEYNNRVLLKNNKLEYRRKLLLCGPPGTGKTATAYALASEFNLPLFLVRLDGLVYSLLGETAKNLRLIFDAIKTIEGVYFFDEFDAVGSDRESSKDVGEMRRVLNSFLQFLEQDESDSFIIAATNNKKLLDLALFRRFDDVIHYDLPDHNQVQQLIERRLSSFSCSYEIANLEVLKNISFKLSHSEIIKACDNAVKLAILSGCQCINMESIENMFAERAIAKNN